MMKTPRILLLAVVLVTAAIGVWLFRHRPTTGRTDTHPKSLLLYCAAGIANPVNAVAREYEKEFGVRVEIQFGGSGTLLNNLKVARRGDLYLAADSSYIDLARKDGLVAEAIPLARLQPVIAVRKGNPKSVRSVDDLARADVRVALANPEAASVGQESKRLLMKLGRWDAVEKAVQEHGVFKPTVNELANDVKIGAVDAAIVWDATVRQAEYRDSIEAIAIPGADAFTKDVIIGVLNSTTQPTAALHFARYLGARDKGLPVFAKMGFTPVDGDAWADHPRLLLYCGAMNRPGIQDTLKAFEQREGVEITTVYNGCGILNGQIKMGERPDAYQTCDISFMKAVDAHFLPAVLVSETDMVMLVKRGNPRGIHTLADLAQPGLRIGIANEEQSTLGTLTANILRQRGIYDAVQKNVVTTTPTADLLVTQISAGSLDAVVVYLTSTKHIKDDLQVVSIDDPLAKADQSFAVGAGSRYKQLMERLGDAVRSSESRARYEQAGFRWMGNAPTP